jgi:hypothetical protein
VPQPGARWSWPASTTTAVSLTASFALRTCPGPSADDADVVVLAGLTGEPEIERATASAPLPLVAFDGVQGAALGDREVCVAMPYAPVNAVPTPELLAGIERARYAANLLLRAAAEGAADRPAMLAALRRLGGFDSHGDPPDPPVWLWRADPEWQLWPELAL